MRSLVSVALLARISPYLGGLPESTETAQHVFEFTLILSSVRILRNRSPVLADITLIIYA